MWVSGGMRTDIAAVGGAVDGGRADKSALLGGFSLLGGSYAVAVREIKEKLITFERINDKCTLKE